MIGDGLVEKLKLDPQTYNHGVRVEIGSTDVQSWGQG